jgi:hypothetical protein
MRIDVVALHWERKETILEMVESTDAKEKE